MSSTVLADPLSVFLPTVRAISPKIYAAMIRFIF